MSQGPAVDELGWRARRRYPRIPISAPVEIYARDTIGPPLMGGIDNLSIGGALLSCRERFDLETELAMLFELPNGPQIRAFGRVVYIAPAQQFGVSFLELDAEAQRSLEQFTNKALGHSRRSNRVPYRSRLTITWVDTDGRSHEESGDSVLVSKNGGLLVCRTAYQEGQELYLWSAEGQCGARARVIFQQTWDKSGLTEVGFEFLDDVNFWQMDFATS